MILNFVCDGEKKRRVCKKKIESPTHVFQCGDFLKKMIIKKKNWWVDLRDAMEKNIMNGKKKIEEAAEVEKDQDKKNYILL